MDEPLSALDAMAKAEILPYFERLHARLALPVLLVTHDIAEVERLADRLVLVRGGRVEAQGALNDLLTDPNLPFARTRGTAAVLQARVAGREAADGLLRLDLDGQAVLVAAGPAEDGATVRLRIAASDVSLALDRPSRSTILNVLAARILSIAQAARPRRWSRSGSARGRGNASRRASRVARSTRWTCASDRTSSRR